MIVKQHVLSWETNDFKKLWIRTKDRIDPKKACPRWNDFVTLRAKNACPPNVKTMYKTSPAQTFI